MSSSLQFWKDKIRPPLLKSPLSNLFGEKNIEYLYVPVVLIYLFGQFSKGNSTVLFVVTYNKQFLLFSGGH
jgi:hypothetical protein